MPPIDGAADARRRARQAGELARAAARRDQPARVAARARRHGRRRSCCTRSATLRVSQTRRAARPDARHASAPSSPSTSKRFALDRHRRRPGEAWPTRASRSRRRSSRTSTTPTSSRGRRSSACTAASTLAAAGEQYVLGARGRAHRALRRDHHRHRRARRHARRFRGLPVGLFDHFLRGDAASRSRSRSRSKDELQPFADKIVAGAESYVVAHRRDNSRGRACFAAARRWRTDAARVDRCARARRSCT